MPEFKWVAQGHDKIKEVFDVLYNDEEIVSLGIGGGGGGGKTFTGSAWSWTECSRFPGLVGSFCKEDLKNARRTILATYDEFCKMFSIPKHLAGHYDRRDDAIKFPNGSKILLIDLKHYPVRYPLADNLGGYLLNNAVVDDSPGVKDVVIEKLYTRINRNVIYRSDGSLYKGKILETFNPHKGRVRRLFHIPKRDNKEKADRKFIPMLVTDWLKKPDHFFATGKIHQQDENTWYANYIKTIQSQSLATQERLLYGNFDFDDNPDAMFPYQLVQNAFSRKNKSLSNFRLLCVDPAYTGKDSLVMFVMRGFDRVEYIIETNDKILPEEVTSRVLEVMHQFDIPASNVCFDADGPGLHLSSIRGAKAFHGGGKVVDWDGKSKKHENLRTQCYYLLSKDFEDGILSFDHQTREYWPNVEEDLGLWERVEISNDKLWKMNSKGHAKSKNGGRSPDFSDALMMSRWLKLMNKLQGSSKYKPALA